MSVAPVGQGQVAQLESDIFKRQTQRFGGQLSQDGVGVRSRAG